MDIEKFGKKYELNHPHYYDEKRARENKEDKKRGIPSAPTDTSFEDVFLKSRNRNKNIAKGCVVYGMSVPILIVILTQF